MATSQNGWTASPSPSALGLRSFPWITGKVRAGDVYEVFDYLCRRFDAEVEKINPAHSWGYAYRDIRGATDRLSNHASATAIDLNAPRHPLGKIGTFSPGQLARIRAILRDLDGAVRWGGDYSGRKDEMHFEVDTSPSRLAQVAAAIRSHPPTAPQEDDMPTPAELVDALNQAAAGGQLDGFFQRSGTVLRDVTKLARADQSSAIAALIRQLDVGADETAIAGAVLAVLTPQAIAAAIPDELAAQVVDELHQRTAPTG